MANRMATSYCKYGTIKDAAELVDQIQSMEKRIKKYKETGNTEWLIDVANMCMIKYTAPNHPLAHFRETNADESPGRRFKGEHKDSQRHNLDFED